MSIKQSTIDNIAGGNDFVNAISSQGVKGLLIPADNDLPPVHKQIKVAYNKDNPRLVIVPLVHGNEKPNQWIIACFHAPDPTHEWPRPNIRGSLALSVLSGHAMVVYDDLALLMCDGWVKEEGLPETMETLHDHGKIMPPVPMTDDIAEDLARQIESPEAFAVGWLPLVAAEAGVDPAAVMAELMIGFAWKGGDA